MAFQGPTDDEILSFDNNDRINMVKEFWPNLPRLVISRFKELWLHSETHKTRSINRHSNFRSKAYPAIPSPDYLSWEAELFEMAFQETIQGMRDELWTKGLWEEGREHRILSDIAPSIRLITAYELSRTCRPNILLPTQRSDGAALITPLESTDDLNGWYLIGVFETEIVVVDRLRNDANQIHTTMAGAIFNHRYRSNSIPFEKLDPEKIWNESNPDPKFWLANADTTHMVSANRIHTAAGSNIILGLAPLVMRRLGLRIGNWPGRLELRDSAGMPAVRFIQWRSRPISPDYLPDNFGLEGCALLARKDITTALDVDIYLHYLNHVEQIS